MDGLRDADSAQLVNIFMPERITFRVLATVMRVTGD